MNAHIKLNEKFEYIFFSSFYFPNTKTVFFVIQFAFSSIQYFNFADYKVTKQMGSWKILNSGKKII